MKSESNPILPDHRFHRASGSGGPGPPDDRVDHSARRFPWMRLRLQRQAYE